MNYDLLILLFALAGLWFGSELTIKGAIAIARRFNLSSGFIGLTVLSIGTSIPEISVSIAGGLKKLAGTDASGIVVGNVIGSAVNQLTLILGVVGLFGLLWIKKRTLRRDGAMLIGSILLLALMGIDGQFSRMDGVTMIAVYLFYLFTLTREEKVKVAGRRPESHLTLNLLSLIGGFLLILFASDYVVVGAKGLAESWGVTQTFIGIFIVGLGTGLPELAVSLAALRKKNVEMSVANLIGSNICDLLFSLGAGTVISGFTVPDRVLIYDIPALLIISITMIFFFRSGLKLHKKEALLLIVLYFVYLIARLHLFR